MAAPLRTGVSVHKRKHHLSVALPAGLVPFYNYPNGERPISPAFPLEDYDQAFSWGKQLVDEAMLRRGDFLRRAAGGAGDLALATAQQLLSAPGVGCELIELMVVVMNMYIHEGQDNGGEHQNDGVQDGALPPECDDSGECELANGGEQQNDGLQDGALLPECDDSGECKLVIEDDIVLIRSTSTVDVHGRAASSVSRHSEPTALTVAVDKIWAFCDSYACENIFEADMEEELRAYLTCATIDDPLITTNAARGERRALSELVDEGAAKNPPRIHCSVARRERGGAPLRLRYNQHRQGSRLSDIVCRPMKPLLWRASCIMQSKLGRHHQGDGEDAMLSLSLTVNVYHPGAQCMWHSDNRTPGPGGWPHNSQRRGSSVLVATLSGEPKRELPMELCFAKPTEKGNQRVISQRLHLTNNRGYRLGSVTDDTYDHAALPVGDHGETRLAGSKRYALLVRDLELWNEFQDRAPYRILLSDEQLRASELAMQEYVETQRLRLIERRLRQEAARLRRGHALDEVATSREWGALASRLGMTLRDLKVLREEHVQRMGFLERASRAAIKAKRRAVGGQT